MIDVEIKTDLKVEPYYGIKSHFFFSGHIPCDPPSTSVRDKERETGFNSP